MPVSRAFAREVTAVLVRLGISQREAAKRTRISPGYISNMCLGQVPSLGKLLQFTGSLDVDPAPLLAAGGYPPVSLPTSAPSPTPHTADAGDPPLLGEVPGGDWRLAACEAAERFPAPAAFASITDFCLRVIGDSMWPHLQHGDVVGVKAQATAEQGQVVVARLGDDVTVKCLRQEQGEWLLAPFNPEYQPLRVDLDSPEFAIVGVVTWHFHDWLAGTTRGKLPLQKGATPGHHTPPRTRGTRGR